MRKRTVINGKVLRTPSLSRYDNMRVETVDTQTADPMGFNLEFVKDAPRTWARDKALLVALGVNGEVPLMQALENAGLAWDMKPASVVAANDNHEIAAKAA